MIGVPKRRESGMPPSASRQVRLSDVCRILNGYAFESALFNQERGTPLIRIRDLRTNGPSERYDGDFDARYLVPPGAYLVGMDGEFRCYKWSGPPALLNQRLCRLLPDGRQVDGDFLYLALNDHLKRIERETSYTTVKHISSRQIAGIELRLPALPEQERIAAVLREQLAAAARMRAAAALQVAATETLVESELRDAFRGITPLAVGSVRDTAPDGWKWHLLLDLARLESGHTPSRRHPEWWGGDIPWLALPDIRELDRQVADETTETTNEQGIANSSARVLPAGTVVLSRTASVGFVAMMGRPMATSQDFVNWVCGPDLDPSFLMYLLCASRSYIRQLSSGAIHKTVYVPTVKAFAVCVPQVTEQKRIASKVRSRLAAHAEIRVLLNDQAAQIDCLPSVFLRQAFSGAA